MKRLLSLVLALVLLFPAMAAAASVDLKQYNDQQLMDLAAAIAAEQ